MEKRRKGHRAKKSLGQNFLKSLRFVHHLVAALGATDRDIVVEVGPGKGSITRILLENALHVIAIEKDDDLHELLCEKFSDEIASGKLDLIHGDILKFDPKEHRSKDGYLLVGSIPYYITGIFIRTFLTQAIQPKKIAIIIQKEVAERIVARSGKESILSISVKVFGVPKYIRKVSAREFTPKPKVDSAIFIITNISRDFFSDISEEKFFTMVKAGYRSKRKKLIGNLTVLFERDSLEKAFTDSGISLGARAENLSYDDWGKLARILV